MCVFFSFWAFILFSRFTPRCSSSQEILWYECCWWCATSHDAQQHQQQHELSKNKVRIKYHFAGSWFFFLSLLFLLHLVISKQFNVHIVHTGLTLYIYYKCMGKRQQAKKHRPQQWRKRTEMKCEMCRHDFIESTIVEHESYVGRCHAILCITTHTHTHAAHTSCCNQRISHLIIYRIFIRIKLHWLWPTNQNGQQ